MLYHWLRPALFRLSRDDPERAHEWVMRLLSATGGLPLPALVGALAAPVQSPRLRQRLFGLTFPNPVGLAAGFDKNALALPSLAALGFGFIEAGTVTYHAQPGNPRPRIRRLPEHGALINRMGFNNDGAAAVARRLARTPRLPVPLGISLGKSRATPLERAVEDYCASFRLLAPFAGYVAVNVSSPNTPGLRALQDRDPIDALLAALGREADDLAERTGRTRVPLLVKVAPDLADEALDELLGVCESRGMAGVIAVNTTLARPAHLPAHPPSDLPPRPPSPAGKGVPTATTVEPVSPVPAREGGRGVRSAGAGGRADSSDFPGGLSGRPLFPRALEVVRHIRWRTEGRLPIIGVGGIFDAADAYAMIRAGASLVQVYTGFIYEGPLIARRINRGVLRLMDRDGLKHIGEAIGVESRGTNR